MNLKKEKVCGNLTQVCLRTENTWKKLKKSISKIKEQYMVPVYSLDFFTGSAADNDIQFLISDQLFLETLLMKIRGKLYHFQHIRKTKRTARKEIDSRYRNLRK